MDATEQFNLRLSKELVKDLDFISSRLRIQKTELVRHIIAKHVEESKEKLLGNLKREFLLGLINEFKFEELTGSAPDKELLKTRDDILSQVNSAVKKNKYESSAKNALLNN